MSDITVCTVNYNTDGILKQNIDLLNSCNDIQIIVGENSPFKHAYHNVKCISGIPAKQCNFKPGNIKEKPTTRFDPGLHHSLTLEKCISQAKSRYVAVIDPDFFLLEPLENLLGYDIIGAPHGKKSVHSCVEFNLPSIDMYPGSFFCLIDRDKVKEIRVDYNKALPEFYHRHGGESKPYKLDFIDTFYPFRQSVYRYHYKSFTVCINDKCSICREICPQLLYQAGNPLERFFFKNRLVGLHFHWRKQEGIKFIKPNTKVYHPLNNFNLL